MCRPTQPTMNPNKMIMQGPATFALDSCFSNTVPRKQHRGSPTSCTERFTELDESMEEPFPEIEWIEDDENNVSNAMLIESMCQSSNNNDYNNTQRGGLVRSRAFADGLALLENRQLSQVSLPNFFQPIVMKESSVDCYASKSMSLSSLMTQALFMY